MKNTIGLLDIIPSNAEVHWLEWEGNEAPTGNHTGGDKDGRGPLYHHTGRKEELAAAVQVSDRTMYLGLLDYWYGEYDYDYDNDPGNLYFQSQEDSLTREFADWVVRYEDCDYHGEQKVIAVRLGCELPDGVYDHFAAVLAARPDPQPI